APLLDVDAVRLVVRAHHVLAVAHAHLDVPAAGGEHDRPGGLRPLNGRDLPPVPLEVGDLVPGNARQPLQAAQGVVHHPLDEAGAVQLADLVRRGVGRVVAAELVADVGVVGDQLDRDVHELLPGGPARAPRAGAALPVGVVALGGRTAAAGL